MKFLKILMIGLTLFFFSPVKSKADVNVTIGLAPDWGPVGYPDVRYYYIPDVYAYYDRNWAMFTFMNNGVWISRYQLPVIYRNYDLYSGYKVVLVGYNGRSPYKYHNSFKVKYPKGYNKGVQKSMKPNPKGNSGNKNYGNPSKKQNVKGNSKMNSPKNNNQNKSKGSNHNKTQTKTKSDSKGKSNSSGGSKGNGGGKGKK
jgi:hypothetical protein